MKFSLRAFINCFGDKYKTAEEYINDVKEEYFADDSFPLCVLIEQKYINPNEIDMDDYEEDIEFPWHGYSKSDFVRLNRIMSEKLYRFQECSDSFEATKLKRKYCEIYNAYFKSPIRIKVDDSNKYHFGSDGRHRIFVARENGNLIPVWVTKYVNKSEVTFDEYVKCHTYGEWRF